jgi:undecaprenyl-diphosphatase
MKLLYAIHKYDVFMFNWLMHVRWLTLLTRICRLLSKSGDGTLYLLLALWISWQQGFNSPMMQTMVLAFAIERPVYFVLKNSLKRNRPQAALANYRSFIQPSDKFSFPSGHTSAAFMMATLLGAAWPEWIILFYSWAMLVGFSRVVLGVHFPTDTLVGAILGLSIALFSLEQMI